jgi:glyoxylase-like metal-dependent hydrolase (beta-lactamase superfamily II)
MTFLTEPEPPRGVALHVLPGIRRVVARNPSVMTNHGTNTFLLDSDDGLTVIDPGPNDAQHVADVVRAAGSTPIKRLVVTHAHADHHGAAKAMQEATGAQSWGYHTSGSPGFSADHPLDDGDEVAGLQAVFTPGHAPDHLSFAYNVPGTGQILFSGDHVMAWSSSIVDPPQGSMRAYYNSLELLLPRPDVLYLPAHGPLEPNPSALVQQLLAHRKMREAAILEALRNGPATVRDIAAHLYAKTDRNLKIAAERNVLAHLLKLQEEAFVVEQAESMQRQEAATDDSALISFESGDPDAMRQAYWKRLQLDATREFSKAA